MHGMLCIYMHATARLLFYFGERYAIHLLFLSTLTDAAIENDCIKNDLDNTIDIDIDNR